MDKAKLFWSGRSQAVRLPRAYRLEGEQVRIRRLGRAIVLEPIEQGWGWLDQLRPVDADFMAGGRDQPPPQARRPFDD